jgi:hypothetical protein
MKTSLDLFNDILFLNLRPWLMSKNPDLKFKQLIKDVKREYYVQQPKYEIAFVKPLSSIRKYYCAIIEAESIRFLNDFHSEIETTYSDSEKSYLVHHVLNKKFSQFLKDIAKLISEKKYSSDQFDLGSNNFSKDRCIADESYILHFLKCSFIRLFLEIQDSYSEFLNEEIVTQEEIYFKYFNEQLPDPSFIKPSKKIGTPIIKKKLKKEYSFEPVRKDIQPIGNSLIDYDMILNKDAFAQVECNLYDFGIIDIESCFIKNRKQSNNILLAAVYRILIDKNYFRRNILGEKKRCTDIDFRKYLDARYGVDTSQQFRKITKEQINDAKVKLPWLDKIYPIR